RPRRRRVALIGISRVRCWQVGAAFDRVAEGGYIAIDNIRVTEFATRNGEMHRGRSTTMRLPMTECFEQRVSDRSWDVTFI
ncbi:MAG: hypothetical protein ACM3ZE_03530, partial [Myxococcales bacterium]